jgi:hypothetical protein
MRFRLRPGGRKGSLSLVGNAYWGLRLAVNEAGGALTVRQGSEDDSVGRKVAEMTFDRPLVVGQTYTMGLVRAGDTIQASLLGPDGKPVVSGLVHEAWTADRAWRALWYGAASGCVADVLGIEVVPTAPDRWDLEQIAADGLLYHG